MCELKLIEGGKSKRILRLDREDKSSSFISILDKYGRILQTTASSGDVEMDVSYLRPGAYCVEMIASRELVRMDFDVRA